MSSNRKPRWDPTKPRYHRDLPNIPVGEVRENKLYVGNLDLRVTEYQILKLFKPFGNIVREEYLWHTHGPKKGEPRGYCFIEYSSREEAVRAKEKMNAQYLMGRPLVVRFVNEKVFYKNNNHHGNDTQEESSERAVPMDQASDKVVTLEAKMIAIKNKLKLMEYESTIEQTSGDGPSHVSNSLGDFFAAQRTQELLQQGVLPRAGAGSSLVVPLEATDPSLNPIGPVVPLEATNPVPSLSSSSSSSANPVASSSSSNPVRPSSSSPNPVVSSSLTNPIRPSASSSSSTGTTTTTTTAASASSSKRSRPNHDPRASSSKSS